MHQAREEADEYLRATPPLTTMNRSAPRGLTAEIMFGAKRCPVTRTTGVSPF